MDCHGRCGGLAMTFLGGEAAMPGALTDRLLRRLRAPRNDIFERRTGNNRLSQRRRQVS